MHTPADGGFAQGEYRRVIPWSGRLEREGPLLRSFLAACPGKRILDLGCGSGEHAAFAASLGYAAVGVDRSEAQIESARELIGGSPGSLDFVRLELADLHGHFSEPFDGAMCLGNVLPHLHDEELGEALDAWASCLRPGARLLLQWLNYTHLRAENLRCLPVSIRPGDGDGDGEGEGEGDGEEVAFVRLMRFVDAEHVSFYPVLLDLPADDAQAPSLRSARTIRLRSWGHDEVVKLLDAAGFELESIRGGVEEQPFEAEGSKDVVIRARRR